MKRSLYLFVVALFALATVGCNKENTPVDYTSLLAGEWHCAPEGMDVDVYVSFQTNGEFEHYQRIGDGGYRHYAGTWFVENDILNGTYSDGTEWGSSYLMRFEGDTMTLTATNESAEQNVYTKTSIPEEVKNSAIAPFSSRTIEDSEVNTNTRWF